MPVRLKCSRIRKPQTLQPRTHLQLFVGGLGQFSSQGVQSLFDRSVHRQHVGQLAQGWIQLTHTSRLKLIILIRSDLVLIGVSAHSSGVSGFFEDLSGRLDLLFLLAAFQSANLLLQPHAQTLHHLCTQKPPP